MPYLMEARLYHCQKSMFPGACFITLFGWRNSLDSFQNNGWFTFFLIWVFLGYAFLPFLSGIYILNNVLALFSSFLHLWMKRTESQVSETRPDLQGNSHSTRLCLAFSFRHYSLKTFLYHTQAQMSDNGLRCKWISEYMWIYLLWAWKLQQWIFSL